MRKIAGTQENVDQGQEEWKDPEATVLVPYTLESKLRVLMQQAEDRYAETTGCRRVRIVEGGGQAGAHPGEE